MTDIPGITVISEKRCADTVNNQRIRRIMNMIYDIYAESSGSAVESAIPVQLGEPETEETAGRKWVLCRNCASRVALVNDRIKVGNADTHIFENPAGIIFRVVCFSEASGAADITGYTDENTWFPGFIWCISLCRGCSSHLGWHYNSGSEDFYGLIADRLTGI